MKAAVWHGTHSMKIEERDPLTLESGEVLIKVRATGICGTDIMIYEGKFPRARPPLVPGHEVAGEVAETRDVPADLKKGDRVVVFPLISCGKCIACRMGVQNTCQHLQVLGNDIDGSFSEYMKTSYDKLYRIPNDFSFEKASLVEPACVAFHAVKRACISVGDTVVVQGAGPIGILTGMIARISGASNIIMSEVQKYRIELARDLGFTVIDASADDVVAEVRRLTDGRGADVVFTAAPVKQAAVEITRMIRPRGRVVIFALFKEPVPVDLINLTFTEGCICGSRVYTPVDFERTVGLVVSGELEVDRLITHKIGLQDVEKGINTVQSGQDVMKVIIQP